VTGALCSYPTIRGWFYCVRLRSVPARVLVTRRNAWPTVVAIRLMQYQTTSVIFSAHLINPFLTPEPPFPRVAPRPVLSLTPPSSPTRFPLQHGHIYLMFISVFFFFFVACSGREPRVAHSQLKLVRIRDAEQARARSRMRHSHNSLLRQRTRLC
jgi:hypothetical protein